MLSLLLVVVAQAAAPKGLGLRELQERARKNDPRTMQVAAQLVNANEALLQRARDQAAYDVARAYWGYQTARNADASVQKVRTRLKDAQQTAQKLLAQKSEQISRSDSMKLDYLAEEVEAQHA